MPADTSNNKIGLIPSTSLVVGNLIGSAIFLMPATLAAFGGISLLGWLLSATAGILLAKVFSSLSKLAPGIDGGPYAFAQKGFGDFAGFLMGWGYWISAWVSNAAIVVAVISALSAFFPMLATNAVAAVAVGLGISWLLTWINTLGIVASGRFQVVTTILKIIPLLLVSVVGLFFIHAGNFPSFNTSGQSNIAAMSATFSITFFAFCGVECATVPAGNVENPEKTVPRATMLGTLLTTAIYMLCTVSVMGILPTSSLLHTVTPIADAATVIGGKYASYFVSAGVAIAAIGALNGWILIQGQIPLAMARDGLFPNIFKKENKHGAPGIGLMIGTVLFSVLLVMNYTKGLVAQFQFLILLSTLTTLVPYLFCAGALVIIGVKKQAITRTKGLGSLAIAGLSFLFSLWAIMGSGQDIVYWGFGLLMAGVPFYVWAAIKKNNTD